MIHKKTNRAQETINKLLMLMARLRHPTEGCPWDKQQTLKTIVPHTLEEAYELADAIESEDIESIKSELGDCLFQVIFYCQIGSESGDFDFADIAENLMNKLTKRHPHIFGDAVVTTAEEQSELWELEKFKERSNQGVLADIPLNLPSLSRAQKLTKRAATVGFDWPDINGAIDKLKEEVQELEEALENQNLKHAEEELGDILFVCANLARFLKKDAESILRSANRKFEQRFNYIETKVTESQKSWGDFTLDELEAFWQAAKRGMRNR